jgi:hypothetical protein
VPSTLLFVFKAQGFPSPAPNKLDREEPLSLLPTHWRIRTLSWTPNLLHRISKIAVDCTVATNTAIMSNLVMRDDDGSATKEPTPASLSSGCPHAYRLIGRAVSLIDLFLGFLSTLVPVVLIAAVYFVIFLILRKSQRRYYAPRTYLGSLREQYASTASKLLAAHQSQDR